MSKETAITLFAEHPVKVGGKRRYQEEVVLKDEAVARQLVTDGICKDVNDHFNKVASDEGVDAGDARTNALIEAINGLSPDDNAAWEKDGRPALKKLTKALDSPVSKEERDAAWLKVQEMSNGPE
ncbi:MAG TPA: hypothetical protein VIQ81_04100 [Gammaproteobacteria bacterium]